MFKRSEQAIMDDYRVPAKRAKFDIHNKNLDYHKTQEANRNIQNDDLWGDDFNEEDIEEMDLIASQACVQKTTAAAYKTSCLKLSTIREKSNLQLLRKNIQGASQNTQDTTEINYSQFSKKLIDKEDHNSTFQRDSSFIMQDTEKIIKDY